MSDLIALARRHKHIAPTHYEGCEADHIGCLVNKLADKIEKQRAEIERLRAELDVELFNRSLVKRALEGKP